jgi:hypothetical protein
VSFPQNLSLNIADKGFPISVYNRSYEKTEAAVARAQKEGGLWQLTHLAACTGLCCSHHNLNSDLCSTCSSCCVQQRALLVAAAHWAGPAGSICILLLVVHHCACLAAALSSPVKFECVCVLSRHRGAAGLGDKLSGYKEIKDFVMSLEKPRWGQHPDLLNSCQACTAAN